MDSHLQDVALWVERVILKHEAADSMPTRCVSFLFRSISGEITRLSIWPDGFDPRTERHFFVGD